MKKILLLLTGIVFICTSNIHAQISKKQSLEGIRRELSNPNSKNVLVVSHRADWRNAPENSIQAIERVINMGVDIIELDIQLTRDSQLVLMHDRTIDRTTSGKGKVSDYTLAELRKFTLRTGTSYVTRQPIPTLEEAMNAVKGKVFVNIDKGYDYFDLAYKILKKTGTVNQAIIKSFLPSQNAFDKYGSIINEMIYMPMCIVQNPAALESTAALGKEGKIKVVEINYRDTTGLDSQLKVLKDSHLKLWFNSLSGGIDDELAVDEGKPDSSWGWYISKGASILQTDRPKEMIEYLRSKKLRHD